jgi:hypothetical protein
MAIISGTGKFKFFENKAEECVQSCLLGCTAVNTRQYNPEDKSEHHTHHRENLKSHTEECAFHFILHQLSS